MSEEARPAFTETDARAAVGVALQRAYVARRWMTAVWRVEGGRIHIDECVTLDFPTGDFDEAVKLLEGKLEKKKEADAPELPPPLPGVIRGPFGAEAEPMGESKMPPYPDTALPPDASRPPAQPLEDYRPIRGGEPRERKDHDAPETD
ncbi:MAG: hypothetical protein V3W28_03700 [Thermoplasmata archaeon]